MRNLICLILLGLSLTPSAFAWEDFYILKPSEFQIERTPSQRFTPLNSVSCRDRIKQVICLVDNSSSPNGPRQCLSGSENFAAPIEKIYDILPEKLQKAFCGLDAIFVESDVESLAYAGIIRANEKGEVEGSFIGVRRTLLETAYDATSVFGWKEQKAFGIIAPPFVHLPDGPRVEVILPHSLSALQYIFIHEIGHILDFANSANEFVCPANETCDLSKWDPVEFGKMIPAANSFGALSWKNPMYPQDAQRFPLWDKLCFYGCNERLTIADMESFYRQLDQTNFVSTYAAVSPYEDFAESFTFHVLSLQGEWNYRVQTPYMAYSLEKKWDVLFPKKSWLEAFYQRDLKYPKATK
ncbi:hypothetical protein ACLWBD_01065 [Bdellovibrio sp. HCB117]|uniref:hypothetical protein n=1 Tax=Bdellovibrio sp. HCB117 TaxID=3394359 RepID=UPI0039B6E5B1